MPFFFVVFFVLFFFVQLEVTKQVPAVLSRSFFFFFLFVPFAQPNASSVDFKPGRLPFPAERRSQRVFPLSEAVVPARTWVLKNPNLFFFFFFFFEGNRVLGKLTLLVGLVEGGGVASQFWRQVVFLCICKPCELCGLGIFFCLFLFFFVCFPYPLDL